LETYPGLYTRFAAHFGKRFRLMPPFIASALAWTAQTSMKVSRGRLAPLFGQLAKLRPSVLTLSRGSYYFSHKRAATDFGYEPIYSIDEGMELTARHQKRLRV
jgi:hypothetical protein